MKPKFFGISFIKNSPLKNSYVYYIPMTSTDKTKGPIVKVDLLCEDINVEFLHLTETLMEYFLEWKIKVH